MAEINDRFKRILEMNNRSQLSELAHIPPSQFVLKDGVLISDFSDLSQWTTLTPAECLTSDTTIYPTGGKFTVASAGGSASADIVINLTNFDSISFDYYTDLVGFSSITAYITTDLGMANKYYATVTYDTSKIGKNTITLFRKNMTATGVIGKNDTYIRLRLKVYAKAGETCELIVSNVRFNKQSRATVTFNADGQWESARTLMFPYLKKYGYTMLQYVQYDALGTSDYGQRDDLTDLLAFQSAGGLIGNHSKTHADFRTLTAEEIAEEYNYVDAWQVANGLTSGRGHFAYPTGYYDADVITALRTIGCKTARTIDGTADYVPLPEPLRLTITLNLTSTTEWPGTAKATLDTAIQNGQHIIIFCHAVAASPTLPEECPLTVFKSIVDYIADKENRNECDVTDDVTFWEVYSGNKYNSKPFSWSGIMPKSYIGYKVEDIASISAGEVATFDVTVTGAAVGDVVLVGAPATINAGLVWSGFVSAADVVTVRVHNTTAGAIDPASATWNVRVFRA